MILTKRKMVLFLGQNWGRELMKKQKITFFWKIQLFFLAINAENILKSLPHILDNVGIIQANKIPFQENLGELFSQDLGQKIPKNIKRHFHESLQQLW